MQSFVPRHPVKSSSLYSVGYCASFRVLDVEFRSGAMYRYFNVPPETYTKLVQAPSKGRYFNQRIRPAFPFFRAAAGR